MKRFDDILNEMSNLYERKNHDYGDSFSKSYKEFGMLSPVIRMSDKLERLKTLCRAENRVDESVRDTLIDLASYSVMTIMEIDKIKEDGEDG